MQQLRSTHAPEAGVGGVGRQPRALLRGRSRDLASLRVLGFRRREISSVLLGEMAIQVLVALP